MTWFVYLLIVMQILGTLGRIIMIGRPREPWTTGQAAFFTILDMALLYGMFCTVAALKGAQ